MKIGKPQFHKFPNSGGGLVGLEFLNSMEILIGMKGFKIACNYIKVYLFFLFSFFFWWSFFAFFSIQKLLFQHIKRIFVKKWPYFALFRKKRE
jgi:hypothetical protein